MARRLDTAFDEHSETSARALLLNIWEANHNVATHSKTCCTAGPEQRHLRKTPHPHQNLMKHY